MTIRLINASAHHLPTIPDASVHLVVCSPPYFGLRKYAGGTGILWPTVEYAPMPGLPPLRVEEWRGELGLEPTPEMFIAHLVLCLREWKRVLRDDGTVWVNLGDSYANSGQTGLNVNSGKSTLGPKRDGLSANNAAWARTRPRQTIPAGLKPKDLCGIPWRFAFAAQAEGFYLRSDIIWDKPNPMPESVTDRCTKAHEYIFMLAKSERYYFDNDAVRESHVIGNGGRQRAVLNGEQAPRISKIDGYSNSGTQLDTSPYNPAGRNRRSVWRVATQPTGFAHFATWPEKLVEPMILAGTSARGCCPRCGAGWVRCVERTEQLKDKQSGKPWLDSTEGNVLGRDKTPHDGLGKSTLPVNLTTGWQPSCTCDAGEPVPAVVLDPFSGSGTTGKVAARLGRDYIGVDISNEYLTDITAQRFGDGIQMTMQGL